MAHQDYSEICPIFNEGVEKEIYIPVQLSMTATTHPFATWVPGREIELVEAALVPNLSDGLSTQCSCTIQIYKNASTAVGSIPAATSRWSTTLGTVWLSGSIAASVFTSTDVITAYFLTAGGAAKPNGNYLVIRYKDK